MLRREESGRIVIEPMRHKEFDLAELLDEITGTNVHRETDACASRQRGLAMARQGVPNAGERGMDQLQSARIVWPSTSRSADTRRLQCKNWIDDLLPNDDRDQGLSLRGIVEKPTAKRGAGSSRLLESAEGNA